MLARLSNRPGRRFNAGGGGGRTLLSASDITYAGYYNVSNDAYAGLSDGSTFALRRVGGQLRFLVGAFTGGSWDLVELAAPANFGDTISTNTNAWVGADLWLNPTNDPATGIFWNEAEGQLWSTTAPDYPGTPYDDPANILFYQSVSTRTLGSAGVVSNLAGAWGFEGINTRRVHGGIAAVPAWFQSQYGVPAYLYGWGGYQSRITIGVSLGLSALFGPDPRGYAVPTTIAEMIPVEDFKVGANFDSGTSSTDWYTNPGSPTTQDRGQRLNEDVKGYFNDPAYPDNPATFPAGSITDATNASPIVVTTGANHGIKETGGTVVIAGVGGNTAANGTWTISAMTANTLTLQGSTGNGNYTEGGTWTYGDPHPDSGWLSPAPDGLGRWVHDDHYFNTGVWIDTPTKHGFVATMTGCTGKAWYAFSTLHFDSRCAEIHIFNPHHLGEAAQGTRNPWNVQPSVFKDITSDLTALSADVLEGGNSMRLRAPCGGAFDPTGKRYYLWIPAATETPVNNVIAVYDVNC